jgi:hypothetical protein
MILTRTWPGPGLGTGTSFRATEEPSPVVTVAFMSRSELACIEGMFVESILCRQVKDFIDSDSKIG